MNLKIASHRKNFARWMMESESIVRIYESRLWRRSLLAAILTQLSFEQEFEMILSAAKLNGNETVLDLACGTGIYARPFSHHLERGAVIGLDILKPMLNYAGKQARKENLKNLHLMEGNAMDLPFSKDSFDVVNCCGALHLFANVPHALREISRVLKRGGRFTFATFRKRANPLAEYIVHIRREVTGINAFRPDELETLLHQAEFKEPKIRHAKSIWLVMSAVK